MTVRIGVVTFPGSLDDVDAARAVRLGGAEPVALWHADADLRGVDAVVHPGGFSYGDYLRAGAIARFAPVLGPIVAAAQGGLPVLGICNGFQILTETKMLPGALLPNTSLTFICRRCHVRVERTDNKFTAGLKEGDVMQFPIAHHEGLFFLPDDELKKLEEAGRVVFRYADPKTGRAGAEYAPNGALNGIAGICSEKGNILGLMPHPERATIPHLNGGTDGIRFWNSIAGAFKERGAC